MKKGGLDNANIIMYNQRMPVKCKICQQEFGKLITSSHLKRHNITTKEYAEKYGRESLSSEEYRDAVSKKYSGENNPNFGNRHSDDIKKLMSENRSGIPAWNKGIKTGASDALLEAIRLREEKYESCEIVRPTYKRTEEMNRKTSDGVKSYAANNPEIMSNRAKKAVETKRANGHDMAVWRGKTHSSETKALISLKSTEQNKKKREASVEKIVERIEKSDLTMLTLPEEIDRNTILQLKCNVCSTEFSYHKQYFHESKYTKDRCPHCYPKSQTRKSAAELELFDFVKELCPDAISGSRYVLKTREIDIYIPSKQIAIEFNGLYWHSESVLVQTGRSKINDSIKRTDLNTMGIRYIGVFEDEWVHNKEIVKSRIANILGHTDTKIYARKCHIVELDSSTSSDFCKKYHIQGNGRSNVRYGLMYDNELVSVMTFSNSNLSRKIKGWEINRFCSKIGYSVIGGASKLFKKFITDNNPESVISYADLRYSDGNLYHRLGFTHVGNTVPNFWYVPRGKKERIHRFTLRKTKDDPIDIPIRQLRESQGFDVIWDCGSSKWEWKKGT